MKRPNFKWLKYLEKGDSDDPILFGITEEMIQLTAETQVGRRLTEKELECIPYAFLETEEVLLGNKNPLLVAVHSVTKNSFCSSCGGRVRK